MAIMGVPAGGNGTFVVSWLNSSGIVTTPPPGVIPVWAVDNVALATIASTSADGLTCVLAGVATGTVNVTATIPAQTPVVATAAVPVTAGSITSGVINQTA
jgi:hypothetical protein